MSGELFSVGACPASPGFGCVVALAALPARTIVFFAPCCGLAWSAPPGRRLDEIHALDELAPGGVALPTRDELARAGFGHLPLTPVALADWADDLPLAREK